MKRLFSFIIIVTLIMSSLAFSEVTIQAPLSVSRTIRNNITELTLDNVDTSNNKIYIDYVIQPDDIDVAQIPLEYPEKEIVLVIDKSGSMDWDLYGNYTSSDSRMDMTKAAAVRFIDALKEYPNVKVSLVEYSTTANTYSSSGKNLFELSNNYERSLLTNRINNINPTGGTNIGDGIRHAYDILNTNSDAEKYMILLSDGEPSAFSVSSMGISQTSYYGYGAYYWNYGNSSSNINSMWNIDFYEGTGNAPKYYVNWSSSGDYGGYALDYSKAMTQRLQSSDLNVNSYFIGFSDVAASNKLEIIAKEIEASYKKAMTADEIDQVYQEIAVEVSADVKVRDILFTDEIPENLEYLPTVEGMVRSGQTLTKSFDNIVYTLNDSKTAYVADPIEFTLEFKVNKSGTYIWPNNTAKIDFTDINGNERALSFNSLNLVAKRTPVENVLASRNNNDNIITWDAYPGALGYRIYQVIDGNDVLISDDEVGTSTTYTRSIQANDYNTSTYRVEAILSGDVSEKGSTVADTVPDILGLRASRTNDTFKIEWLPIDGATSYSVTPVIKGVQQTPIIITSPTYVGGFVRYNYDLPLGLTYDFEDTIKFIVDATKVNSDVNSDETQEFLLKQLVETSINNSDISNFNYAQNQDVHIFYESSDQYPTGVSVYDPLLVLELNLPAEVSTTPLQYSYSTLQVLSNDIPLDATIVRSSGSQVKLYVSLENFDNTGLPVDTNIEVIANFAIGYEGNNGQLTPDMFAKLQAINPNVQLYNIGNYIESLLDGAYTTPVSELLEIKSYVLYNKTNQVTSGIFTRDEVTGMTSDYILLKNEAEILPEF